MYIGKLIGSAGQYTISTTGRYCTSRENKKLGTTPTQCGEGFYPSILGETESWSRGRCYRDTVLGNTSAPFGSLNVEGLLASVSCPSARAMPAVHPRAFQNAPAVQIFDSGKSMRTH